MCFRRPFDLRNPQSPEELCIGATGARQESTQLKNQLDMNLEYSESTTASKYETRKNLKIWASRHSSAKTENSNNDK